MLGKIFASIILIAVLYTLWVFLAPALSDSVADKLGILGVNNLIRDFKNGADSTSETLLQIKDASWAINGVRDFANQANEKINQTSEMINGIRQTTEQKVQQAQKTADSIKRAGEAVSEVQNNLSSLASFSWQTSSTGSIK